MSSALKRRVQALESALAKALDALNPAPVAVITLWTDGSASMGRKTYPSLAAAKTANPYAEAVVVEVYDASRPEVPRVPT